MKANHYVPDGFHTVTPYLHVQGAEKLIDFLKQAFGAEELNRSTDADGRIRHAEIRLEGSIIECSEGRDPYPPMQSAIHLYVRDTDKCYEQAIAAGAASLYEPADMPYGERSAGVKDPFGNHWYIATFMGTVR
ncbi:Glyoxalase-like domain [Chlamydia abortus]|uniref:VOC family protein n=1 Tax=unclassified Paenibacillus TaxID=185978 RepID=UPI000A27D8C2|nr:VOC family protein [Paenibacillus sp. J2TS4]GIP32054.1 glyoxalase [Paenibacillus sp. J2TS4]SHE13051.1 Glyoxalase-like domain [Chlamydia abortus]